MASIVERGPKYRAQISLYKRGEHKKLTKTFDTKKEAQLWVLENELEKSRGKDLAGRTTTFADFFDNWIYVIKKNDVKETTFQNYLRASSVVRNLFKDIQLKDLNDILVQRRIDEYSQTHSRKTTHEVLLKVKSALRDAYCRGYLSNDFAGLLKTRGQELPKRNKALSITDFKKLRNYVLENSDKEFNLLVLVALETGMRRGELLGIRHEDLFEYGIKVRRSISPTSEDTSLKTKNSKRDISINKDIYQLLKNMPAKENGYIFGTSGFSHSALLRKLLTKLGIEKTTFHGLRDTHASFLFSQEIDIAYVSQRLGHINIQTTQNYYLELMPEKKHQQDADALSLLNSLSN